jgi:hypothetical protein
LHGGIKADIDIECLKSFEPLLQYDSFGGRSYGNFFVGVPLVGMSKGNLIAREAGNAVNTAVATKWKNKYDPGFVKFLDAPPVPALLKCECILPREAFYPLGWGMKNYKNSLGRNSYEDYPNSYAVHHWSSLEEAQNSKAWETIITKAGEKERNSKCVVKRTPRSF